MDVEFFSGFKMIKIALNFSMGKLDKTLYFDTYKFRGSKIIEL